jgi:hypothetical protein
MKAVFVKTAGDVSTIKNQKQPITGHLFTVSAGKVIFGIKGN